MTNRWQTPLSSLSVETNFLANDCGHSGYGGYLTGQYHIGTDYYANGNDPVYSIGDGVMLNNNGNFGSGYGSAVFVKYTAGDGTNFIVMYGHVNASSISNNTTVHAGDQLTTIYPYTTGGAHLHLGIVPGTSYPSSNWGNLPCASWPGTNSFVDPMPFLDNHWATPHTLSAVQPISVGPAGSVTMYTPVQYSYRVKNTSGSAASVQKFIVAVRGPGNTNQDVTCANGSGVSLQPNDEWTCSVNLAQGYGQTGTFTFWADWQDYANNWHAGELGSTTATTLQVTAATTLTTTGALSVGPANPQHMYQQVFWSYRVRNTSGGYASIKRFIVAVRTPGGGNMDVTCDNGSGVTLAPNQEWTCSAYNNSGYGSTGSFPFWADWQDYANVWHPGNLSPTLTLSVIP
jgi:hypothetical protein